MKYILSVSSFTFLTLRAVISLLRVTYQRVLIQIVGHAYSLHEDLIAPYALI